MSNDARWIVLTIVGSAVGLAGLILQQSNSLRGDIDATNLRIDVLTETVAQMREVQAQHSVKLDQQGRILERLAEREPVQEATATLAHSATD